MLDPKFFEMMGIETKPILRSVLNTEMDRLFMTGGTDFAIHESDEHAFVGHGMKVGPEGLLFSLHAFAEMMKEAGPLGENTRDDCKARYGEEATAFVDGFLVAGRQVLDDGFATDALETLKDAVEA